MVCFFEVAFENDLRFPLHPFIKRVLQHFNVCPSLLSPNFLGALVGLLVVFRDKGLGVPSIALLMDLFSVKEVAEGFLYISKRTNAKLIISDLPSSHKHLKERYFFVSGRNLEYNPADWEDTLDISTVWTTPKNLREFPLALIGYSLRKSWGVSNFALVVWPSGIRPGLNPEDEEVKQKLVKCGPWTYSELIRSNISGPSSAKSSQPPALRPSPPSVMKPSHGGTFIVKPTQEELQARVEALAKKRRSVKRKAQASPESSLPARGKTPKMEASAPPSFAKERGSPAQVLVRGQALPSLAEVSEVAGPQLRPSSSAGAKDSLRKAAKPPLEVLPIYVGSPPVQSTELPLLMPEDVGRDRFGAEGDEDSLLTNAELATEVVSSIIQDSDLKKADALSVKEALVLSLKGVVSVCPDAFTCLSHCCFKLSANSISFFGIWLLI